MPKYYTIKILISSVLQQHKNYLLKVLEENLLIEAKKWLDELLLFDNDKSIYRLTSLKTFYQSIKPKEIKFNTIDFQQLQQVHDKVQPIIEKGLGRNLPRVKLVSIEQTTNFGGGAIWPLEQLKSVCDFAHENGVYSHLDGARIFNASIATGVSIEKYAKYFDSVYLDFAKGLGAPIGTVLAGGKEFIEEAWYYKFQQGGSMHQSGILAASCIYALDNNIARFAQDHENTTLLAEGLSQIPQIDIRPEDYTTNIIFFSLRNTKHTAESFIEALKQSNVRMLALEGKIRAVLHMDISETDVKATIEAVKRILG